MKNKKTYDDIRLGDKVTLPNGYRHLCNGYGEISSIDNMALLDGIDEPIFKVNSGKVSWFFGLKYVTKNILQTAITILLIMTVSIKSYSQAFASINLGTSHAGLSVGVESNNVAFTVAMAHSYLKTQVPNYYSMQAGYVYHFTDENSFVIGLHAGGAYSQKKVIKDNEVAQELKEFKGIYTLEAGKNMGSGRLSITGNYIDKKLYYGISIKCFF